MTSDQKDRSRSNLRELWDSGKPTLGGWCVIPSSFSAELMGLAGFDWVCIDTQHGMIGYDQMLPMLQAFSITQTPAFVRVLWNQPGEIMKALDAGAQGVIVPMVNTIEEAQAAVRACRYPPDGNRSWGSNRAAFSDESYNPRDGNRGVICAIMVETIDAIDRLPEILTVPGIDAVFVGPSDLALTAGMKPNMNVEEPAHERLIDTILKVCVDRGIVAGIYCGTAALTARWRNAGFRMLVVNADARMLRSTASAELRQLRDGAATPEKTSGYM
jgi:4-hydroxy-2-oxoheptanedioate aldolase